MKHIRLFSTVNERTSVVNDHPYDNILSYTKENCGILISRSMPNNEIWYTSSNGNIISPNSYDSDLDTFGANIVSNVYENGIGIITFDNDVTTIVGYAFESLSRLTSITIPGSVTTIGDGAFSECTHLTSVTIPNSVTTIGQYAFADCTGLTSVTIPNCVTSIGMGAFAGCTGFTSINIPSSVTTIDGFAFSSCTGLTSINIPSGVTTIGGGAFQNCTSLTSIDIPDGVTTIGGGAFQNCTSLTSITCEPTTPPTLSNADAFTNTNKCPIYVPAASVTAYRDANKWNSIGIRIKAIQS